MPMSAMPVHTTSGSSESIGISQNDVASVPAILPAVETA